MLKYQARYDNNPTTAAHCLCLIHPIDPRGSKVGGIETHVRLLLQHAPDNWRVLMVGVDGYGDCKIGELTALDINGRRVEFLPVIHFPETEIHEAARSLQKSLTARFGVGLLQNLFRIQRAIGPSPASIELQRFEFAAIPFLLRRPAIQIVHGEGSKRDTMDSLIKKYWFLHRTMEETALRLADAIVCVNPTIEAKIKQKLPAPSRSIEFMPVPVDTAVFKTAAFDATDGVFRVVFAGRLDGFKDPPTMFRTLRAVHDRLGGKFEFHYVGTSDPNRYPEFGLIDSFTRLRGYSTPPQVAAIIAQCHAGILTSFFEGMPCYLLELLSVGRPVAAIRLPQYDLVVQDGVSGALLERLPDDASTADRLADRMLSIWAAIQRGEYDPHRIRAKAEPFSTQTLLGQHFARHQRVAQSKPRTSHPFNRRRLSASLGVLFPWTVDVRYALSIKLRRALSMPVERDFQVIKFQKTRPGEVFCDIGCNRGQSIESLLLFNKSCQIIAFEPNPITFEKARAKYEGNPRIAIHNVGLSAERSRRTLFIPRYRATYFDELASFDCASARSWFSGDRLIGFDDRLVSLAEFSSEVTTLDDYALSPAFIKIDVQGYETKVLQGAWSTISRAKPILLIENDEPSSAEAVSGLLRTIGYQPHRFDGEKLHRNEFGSPNTLYIVPELERGLDEVMT